MSHDRNGVLIEPGDIVRGKGYNLKCELVGPVVKVEPGQSTCNVHVALAHRGSLMAGVPTIDNIVEHGTAAKFEVLLKGGWHGQPPPPPEASA